MKIINITILFLFLITKLAFSQNLEYKEDFQKANSFKEFIQEGKVLLVFESGLNLTFESSMEILPSQSRNGNLYMIQVKERTCVITAQNRSTGEKVVIPFGQLGENTLPSLKEGEVKYFIIKEVDNLMITNETDNKRKAGLVDNQMLYEREALFIFNMDPTSIDLEFLSTKKITEVRKEGNTYKLFLLPEPQTITVTHKESGAFFNITTQEINVKEVRYYIVVLPHYLSKGVIEKPIIQTEFVVIISEPTGAQVFVDNKLVGKTPFSGEYDYGQHNYKLEFPMYYPEEGIFSLDANKGRQNIDIKLRPNYGSVSITSLPEGGAEVLLNDNPTGKKTPCTLTNLKSGKQKISLKLDMYYDASEEFVVEDSKTAQVNLSMKPAFGVLNINTTPESDIYINGQKEGFGNYKGRKLPGIYTIEVRKDKYTPDTKRIEITDGQEVVAKLNPLPQYGQIKIITNPPDAEIYLDGKKAGISPLTLREVLIGDYNLELKKQGYANFTQKIKITYNQTSEINETLTNGSEILITSWPLGAKLEIDGIEMGATPFNGMLSFGSHSIKLINNSIVVNEQINVTQEGQMSWDFDVNESTGTFTHTRDLNQMQSRHVSIDSSKGAFTDTRDRKTYNWVEIGNQIWMAENLNYATNSGSWCYDDNTINCSKYGRLYNWETAETACPIGWHLPSDAEWTILIDYVGSDAGNKLKSNAGWNNSGNGTYISGFTALPGGYRYSNGSFNYVGNLGYWWSSTEDYTSTADYRNMYYGNSVVGRSNYGKSNGFSVRCVRDTIDVLRQKSEVKPIIKSNTIVKEEKDIVIQGGKLSQDFDINEKTGTFTDTRDGKIYKWVRIGTQNWMAKNLNYATSSGSWCYNNNISNCKKYGRLYNWETAKNICPYGWHLPSDEEWNTLEVFLGLSKTDTDKLGFRGTLNGKKLKSKSVWFSNGNGLDVYNFTALPGGYRKLDGTFNNIEDHGFWWSSTEGLADNACDRLIAYNNNSIFRAYSIKGYGYSVRCVSDN